MKRQAIFALLALVLILVGSCKSDSTEPDPTLNIELTGSWIGYMFIPELKATTEMVMTFATPPSRLSMTQKCLPEALEAMTMH
jgi:hypothetical protein